MENEEQHLEYEFITKNWGPLNLRRKYDPLIREWLIDCSKEEKGILLRLLENFDYYDEDIIKTNLVELENKFKDKYTGKHEELIFTGIEKEFGISNSAFFLSLYRYVTNNDSIERNIIGLIEEDQIPKEIVILDDFAGTGKSFIKLIDKWIQINSKVENSHFYFLVYHITHKAIETIQDYANRVGIIIDICELYSSREAFSSGFIFQEDEILKVKERFEHLSVNRNVNEKYIWGYEETEALVSFSYSSPNNTLGIFWAGNKPLFIRTKASSNTYLRNLRSRAKKRKERRSQPPELYGIDDKHFQVMLGYLFEKNGRFNLGDFANYFEIDTWQVVDFIIAAEKLGYIEREGKRMIPTAKLKSHMFISRIKRNGDKGEKKEYFSENINYLPKQY